jgi:hypothetical protein
MDATEFVAAVGKAPQTVASRLVAFEMLVYAEDEGDQGDGAGEFDPAVGEDLGLAPECQCEDHGISRIELDRAGIDMVGELKIVTSVTNQAEAELLCGRLMEAGIHAMSRKAFGGPEWGLSSANDVLVNAEDLERAREMLGKGEEPISDEELARQSEEAGREAYES